MECQLTSKKLQEIEMDKEEKCYKTIASIADKQ